MIISKSEKANKKLNNPESKANPGYKLTSLGWIPEEWEVKMLKDICVKFLNGGTPSTKIVDFWNGKIPWITGADIIEQKLIVRKFITENAVKKSSTNIVTKGNILMVTRTGVGKLIIAPFDVAISQDLTGLFLNNKLIEVKFAYYFFTGNKGLLRKLNQGTSINGITRVVLESIKLALPTIPEQTTIANLLSTWDKAILTLSSLITQKELRKKWLMQQLLTGKKRLKGFLENWKEMKLDEVAKIVMGQSPSSVAYNENGFGLPLIQGNADIENRKTIIRYWTKEITKICEAGDIIMSVRAPVGTIGIATSKSCIGRGVCSFKSYNNTSQIFLYYFFENYENKWRSFEQGSTFSSVNSNDIKNLSLKIPVNLKERTTISNILQSADKEIQLLKSKLEKLKKQKKGLMQVLLTGKVRVKI